NKGVGSIPLPRTVLIANGGAAVRAGGGEGVGGQALGEGIGTLNAQPMAEALVQSHQKRVVPGCPGRLDYRRIGRTESLKGNSQGDVAAFVSCHPANRIGYAGQAGLVHGALPDEV